MNLTNPNLARPTKQRSTVSMLKVTGKSTSGRVKHDSVILLLVRLDRRKRMQRMVKNCVILGRIIITKITNHSSFISFQFPPFFLAI